MLEIIISMARFQSKLVGDGSPGHVLMYDNREQSARGWSITAFASHPESFRLVSNHLNGVFPFISYMIINCVALYWLVHGPGTTPLLGVQLQLGRGSIAKRLKWITVYMNWTVEDFEGVI